MPTILAEEAVNIEVRVGQRFELESLRQSVVPPYLMLMPFLELPNFLELEEQRPLGEDGVHGCVFAVRAMGPGQSELVVGFRDLQTGETTHRKSLPVEAR